MKTLIPRLLARLTDPYQLLLLLAIGLYTWVFARLAIRQHLGMRTHKADLGQIDQAVWNSSRGRFVETTDFGFLATRMTDHVEPVLALISPIYWFWDDTRAILILQTLFVAAGAWILYHLTLRHFRATLAPAARQKIWLTDALLGLARPVALSLAAAWLLAPPLQAAVLTEFHAVPLAAPLVLWALWAVAAQRHVQFVLAVLLVAAVKEETALLAAGLGAWAVWRMAVVARWDADLPSPRPGPILLAMGGTLVSLLWFYLATFVIVPLHAEPVYGIAESGYFARYGALGDSPADILRSFFTRPGLVWQIATEPVRLEYLHRLLMPFGYLSLLAPDVILLSLPVLLANQLSAYPAQYYGEYHYSAPVIVYFGAAAALGAARLWRVTAWLLRGSSASFQHLPAAPGPVMNLVALFQNARTGLRPLVATGLAIWLLSWGTLSYLDSGRGPGGPRLDATPVTDHHRLLPRFTAQIPHDARVTATAAVHPHVSHRRFVYQFPTGLDAPTPPHQQAEWALLDVTMAVDMAPGDLRARVAAMLAGEWGVVDAADGFLLLHKGASEKAIPPAFYTFVAPENPASPAISGDPSDVARLRLVRTELIDRPYWRATQIVSLWQTGVHFADSADTLAPRLAVYHPQGDLLDPDLNATAPGLTWLPVDEWGAGQSLQIATLPHYLPATWGLVVHDELGPRLAGAYWRGAQDVLYELPLGPDTGEAGDLAELLGLTPGHATPEGIRFLLENGVEIRLRAWFADTVHPGGAVDLFMAWTVGEGQAWPADANVFVHLRAGTGNVQQADGKPRYFMAGAGQADGEIWDWRRLEWPEDDVGDLSVEDLGVDLHAPAWELIVGVYDPQTGSRATVMDDGGNTVGNEVGNEVNLGPVRRVAPPLPDQTCALIPATCAAQPPG